MKKVLWALKKKSVFFHIGVEYCLTVQFSSVQFSHSVMSYSLQSHELQHARPPCPSPTSGIHPNSCLSSRLCHPAISSSVVPFFFCPQSLPASKSFPAVHMRWPKYWSFSFSIIPSKEIPGLSSFRMDWLDLLSVQGLSGVFSNTTVQKHQFFGTQLSSRPTFTSIRDHWKNHSLDYMDLCWQSNISAF